MEETIIIYTKENEYEYKTKVISSEEQIPSGWVDDPKKLGLKVKQSEFSRLTNENKLLSEKVEKQEEDITNTQMAITDIFEMIESVV